MFSVIIKIIGVFLSIFSFSVYLETPKNHIVKAGFVGAVGGCVYLICTNVGWGNIIASFFSALAVALVSHILARIFKTPVTLFLVAGILPTVPGAGMYRIVHYILIKDEAMTAFYMMQTLEIAGAIALAIFLIDSLFKTAQIGEWKRFFTRCVRTVLKGKNNSH